MNTRFHRHASCCRFIVLVLLVLTSGILEAFPASASATRFTSDRSPQFKLRINRSTNHDLLTEDYATTRTVKIAPTIEKQITQARKEMHSSLAVHYIIPGHTGLGI